MSYCLLVLAQLEDVGGGWGGEVGNSDIAHYTRLSRQTVNECMKAAEERGYCSVKKVVWRKNDGAGNIVYAKRYGVTSLWNDTYRHFWAAKLRNGKTRYGK